MSVPMSNPRVHFVRCSTPFGFHRMAYTDWGDPANSKVLICVHGLTRSGRDFDALAAALSTYYRVICPDVVGRGCSDWLTEPGLYTLPQYIADMQTLIVQLGVDTVDWFGTSMGGLIGIMLAGLPDTPIVRILLNDIGPRLELAGLKQIYEYMCQPVQFASLDEGIDYLAAASASFGPLTRDQWRALNTPLLRQHDNIWRLHYDPAIVAGLEAALTPEVMATGEAQLWQAFEAIRTPVLVVRGAKSNLLSRTIVDEMVRRGQRVTHVEIPAVGHAPAFVDADQIQIAHEFLHVFIDRQYAII